MRNLIVVLTLAGALCAAGCEEKRVKIANEDTLGKAKTLAVWAFVDSPGEKGKGSGQVVVNAVVAELYQYPGVNVVESAQLKGIVTENDLKQYAGQNTVQLASALGKRAGADLVFVGEVTQYEAQQNWRKTKVVVTGEKTTYTHRVGLSIRGVDVSNSRVVFADLGQGVSDEGYSPAAKIAAQKALEKLKRFYEEANGPRK